ncbi:hypothetical protein RBWH47_00020 [Rhodopirellula baltica WH47]|uniref:Uncharacterized protein n=1 Tax=Rhodopirellula baltica WH47 TaxID=991778 RepID=F2B079_RHOBT|nr:hypothetical protein RBWH47_00020 [Rhodopirellula baltica WH47]
MKCLEKALATESPNPELQLITGQMLSTNSPVMRQPAASNRVPFCL